MRRLPFDEIRNAAHGNWVPTLPALGIPAECLNGKNQPCPGCGGTDRFQFNTHSKVGAFVCRSHPKGGGDGFTLVQHVFDCDFKEAARLVGEVLGIIAVDGQFQAKMPTPTAKPAPAIDWLQKKHAARSMWTDATAITQTDPAGRYLTRRALPLPATGETLRFHPNLPYWSTGADSKAQVLGRFPALLARVINEHGAGVAVHRIYLTEAGEKLVIEDLPAKKIFKCGDLAGAAVRLAKPDDVLGVAEGIENALAFGLAAGLPVWSGVSAAMLQGVKIPDSVRTVHIGSDPDEPGQRAAHALAQRLANEGREVFIHAPPCAGDWNDWLLARACGVTHGE